jgi:hypothetical protein
VRGAKAGVCTQHRVVNRRLKRYLPCTNLGV